MKKVLIAVLTFGLSMSLFGTPVYASSLDDVVNDTIQDSSETTGSQSEESSFSNQGSSYVSADEYIENTKNAADLTSVELRGANKVNDGIRTVAAFIVRILSYFLTAFLVVRIVLDLVYIALPFTRSILSNGYAGNAAAGGGGMGMQQPGMGMGGMGMGGQQGQPGASPAMGRNQWVSNAALNAVAYENVQGPDGKPQSAYKFYAKEMGVVLIITPVLLTLAITGTLTNLGFLIGDVLAQGINNLGGMI